MNINLKMQWWKSLIGKWLGEYSLLNFFIVLLLLKKTNEWLPQSWNTEQIRIKTGDTGAGKVQGDKYTNIDFVVKEFWID